MKIYGDSLISDPMILKRNARFGITYTNWNDIKKEGSFYKQMWLIVYSLGRVTLTFQIKPKKQLL